MRRMSKIVLTIAVMVVIMFLLMACDGSQHPICTCQEIDLDPELTQIFETWEIYEYILDASSIPESLVLKTELEVYPHDVERVAVYFFYNNPEEFAVVDTTFGLRYDIVKYINGEWRIVPYSAAYQIRNPRGLRMYNNVDPRRFNWHPMNSLRRSNRTFDVLTIYNTDLYLGQFTPGLYRIIWGPLAIRREWNGNVWTEFVVQGEHTCMPCAWAKLD